MTENKPVGDKVRKISSIIAVTVFCLVVGAVATGVVAVVLGLLWRLVAAVWSW